MEDLFLDNVTIHNELPLEATLIHKLHSFFHKKVLYKKLRLRSDQNHGRNKKADKDGKKVVNS